MSEMPEFILDRQFDAPREMVWRAWTDPKILPRWYGPGADTIIHRFDLEPEGLWLGEMRWGDNAHYSKVTFKEVTPPERLVWHHANTDADWNIISSPMMEHWPRVLLTTVTFEELGEKTNVRLSWVPLDATVEEIECFKAAIAGGDMGWEHGYKVIDEILAEMRAAELG